MQFPDEQVQELKQYCKKLLGLQEGGKPLFLMKSAHMPPGCTPEECDVLFCPVDRGDGYPSRLYFQKKIAGPFQRNWTGTVRIAEENWEPFSWKVNVSGLSLAALYCEHISALVRA